MFWPITILIFCILCFLALAIAPFLLENPEEKETKDEKI